jgi:hypothetical protein
VPATRKNPATDGTGPWVEKLHRFPKLPQAFTVDVTFSFGDKVFWADLSQGVAYPSWMSASSSCPTGTGLPTLTRRPENDPAKVSRTMGCVQGSIKFVCIINRSLNPPPANKMVKVWALESGPGSWGVGGG